MSTELSTPEVTGLPDHDEDLAAARPVRFGEVLEQVFAGGEPPIQGGVAEVYRRAERMRRARLRAVIAAGAVAALLAAAVGYVLTTSVVPSTPRRNPQPAEAAPAPEVDPVLTILRGTADGSLRIVPRAPAAGPGWRQYTVLHRKTGRPHGMIEVSVYSAPDGVCFPVLADPQACARPEYFADDVEYARYADDRDVDWQVYQAMGRRLSDGRLLAVMSTGERGTGDADTGRPPLTPLQTATLATDTRLMSAFGPGESCNGPDPACPLLKVPVPVTTR